MVAEKEDTEDESLRIEVGELLTERLVMRKPREDDIPALVELANNRRIAEMLARLPHPYTETEARAFITLVAGQPLSGAAYALTRKDSGQGSHEGHHHYLPRGLVAGVEGDRVRLSANADVAVAFEEEGR